KLSQHNKDKDALEEFEVMKILKEGLENGKPARSLEFTKEQEILAKELHLLTSKPVLYVANVAEDEINDEDNEYVKKVKEYIAQDQLDNKINSDSIEKEMAELSSEEKDMYLEELSIEQSVLDILIKATYYLLGNRTYITASIQQVSAWTFKKGMTPPQA